jgi:putative heme-binding domain-containing protein
VQAAWRGKRDDLSGELVQLLAHETDRIVFYSAWNALRDLLPTNELKQLLDDSRPRIRLAALLALFLDDKLSADEVLPLRSDKDQAVAKLVELWLQKTGNAAPLITLSPAPGEYSEAVTLTAKTSIPRGVITYTTDGSVPAMTSQRVAGPIPLERDTEFRFSVFQDYTQAGAIMNAEYRISPSRAYRHRPFITKFSSDSGADYNFDWTGLAPGKKHYTDREYRILEVPDELAGLPFLRTANGDDRRLAERLMSFHSDSEVTVLVGVDARNPEPLKWMKVGQPDGYQETGLRIVTSDPVFDVYERRFQAGEISLGANLNHSNDSGRGNYIVVFKRDILPKQGPSEPATMDAVLAAMDDADPNRGRELFLHPQGAGCFKCHQMQGIGHVLGPDLSDIGNRAKEPDVLIESIIHPSKVITEGFAQQKVLTVDGRIVSGSVLEETGRLVKLAGSDGRVTTVQKDNIEERVGTKTSPLPDGFSSMMTAQQLADLAAWLMTQKVLGDRDGFWFQDTGDSLNIHFGEQQIATYLNDHAKLTRRALVNVTTPGGIQVTRNYPPRKPDDVDPGYGVENGIIHPHMHPGIWLGFGDVHGNDYWRLQSEVVFDRFAFPPKGERSSGTFAAVNRFLSEDGQREICQETTRYHFQRVPEGVLLHLDAEYRSDEQDFYFGDQEESGLAVRVASPIRVQGGNGTILNDRGEQNGAQVWGKEANWFDYFGTIGDHQVGVMVVPSPDNSRQSWLHARDYGVIVTNPFPKQPKERREPYVKTWVKRGETFKLSYAILIHDLPVGESFDRDGIAESLRQSFDDSSGTKDE